MTTPSCGVVVPVRAFSDGKQRLAAYLDPSDRARLLRAMAERVVGAAGSIPVVVVSGAPDVAEWAEGLGIPVLDDPGGLDAAADAGRRHFADAGAGRVIVAHADLPLVDDLGVLARPGTDPVALLVPCHRDDGTPLLSIPAGADFHFAYGPGSFARHREEARRLRLRVEELRDDPRLRRDVDSLDDLEALARLEA